MEEWEELFREVAMLPKKEKTWQGACAGRNVSPAGVFLESLGLTEASSVEPRGQDSGGQDECRQAHRRFVRGVVQLEVGHAWNGASLSFLFLDDPYLGAWSELMKRKADGERGNARVLRADACDATMTGQRIENIKRSLKNNALIALTVGKPPLPAI